MLGIHSRRPIGFSIYRLETWLDLTFEIKGCMVVSHSVGSRGCPCPLKCRLHGRTKRRSDNAAREPVSCHVLYSTFIKDLGFSGSFKLGLRGLDKANGTWCILSWNGNKFSGRQAVIRYQLDKSTGTKDNTCPLKKVCLRCAVRARQPFSELRVETCPIR